MLNMEDKIKILKLLGMKQDLKSSKIFLHVRSTIHSQEMILLLRLLVLQVLLNTLILHFLQFQDTLKNLKMQKL
jgi:hypothetical protein